MFGTVVFATFGGFYFWWPKFTGKMLDERLGKIHFWTLFVGFHTTFLVQHWLGAEGMPRRYADYLAADGFTALNTISSIGAFLLGLSTLPFLYNVWKTAKYGEKVEVDDPWGYGRSLEWATSCPPPRHNFIDAAPDPLRVPGVRPAPSRVRGAQAVTGSAPQTERREHSRSRAGPDRARCSSAGSTHLELEAHEHHMDHHHVEARGPGAQQAACARLGLQRAAGGRDPLGRLLQRDEQPDDGRATAYARVETPRETYAARSSAGGVRGREARAVRRAWVSIAVDAEGAPVVAVEVPGDQVPAALGADQAVRFDGAAGDALPPWSR